MRLPSYLVLVTCEMPMTVLTRSSDMGTAVIGFVAVGDESPPADEGEEVEDSRLKGDLRPGTTSSRRRAKRAARIDEFAGVNEANEGIFLPGRN